jgi:hypothetical protein
VCSPIRQGNTQVWQVTHVIFWRRPRPAAGSEQDGET